MLLKWGNYSTENTVETRYNDCSWDHENSYVITIYSLYALYIELFSRVGTKKCVRISIKNVIRMFVIASLHCIGK